MKVGFCSVNFSEWALPDVIELAARKGYEAIELPSYTDNGQLDPDEILVGDNAKKLKKQIEDAGLEISSISNHADSPLILGPHGKDCASVCDGTKEEQIAFGQNSMIRSAQIANALEVPAVIAFSGVGNFGRFNDWPYPNGWMDEEAAFLENWVPVFDKFREYGVKVAFEPHPNNIVYDIHSTERCLALCDNHEAFGINLDPANMFYMGISIGTFINKFGSRIVTVHAKDCEMVAHNMNYGGHWMLQRDWGETNRSFRFRIPGWGSVDWKSVITELYLNGFDGVYSYEHEDVTMSRMDGTDKTIEFLKPLMIKAPYEGRNDKLFQK